MSCSCNYSNPAYATVFNFKFYSVFDNPSRILVAPSDVSVVQSDPGSTITQMLVLSSQILAAPSDASVVQSDPGSTVRC